jgi:tRNA threonylcarbamoyladenosine biosynthesis protein TsaE
MYSKKFHSLSESDTIAFAKEFAEHLSINDIVTFIGELGTGKTVFVKAICEYFKVEEIVTSPTFTLINQYIGNFRGKEFDIFHIDLYRINKLEEIQDLGFTELITTPNSLKLIEWAEKVIDLIPPPFYRVDFSNVENKEDERIITVNYIL